MAETVPIVQSRRKLDPQLSITRLEMTDEQYARIRDIGTLSITRLEITDEQYARIRDIGTLFGSAGLRIPDAADEDYLMLHKQAVEILGEVVGVPYTDKANFKCVKARCGKQYVDVIAVHADVLYAWRIAAEATRRLSLTQPALLRDKQVRTALFSSVREAVLSDAAGNLQNQPREGA